MKVLVSTKKTQGQRKNDFCHANESEILRFAFECDGGSVDDKCGCRRSLSGVKSARATTTFLVEDRPISKEDFTKTIKDSLAKSGWPVDDEFVNEDVKNLLKLAEAFPVGTVVEKRGNKFQERGAVKV